MFEQIAAGLGLALCAGAALHLVLGAERLATWRARGRQWLGRRRHRQQAEREAADVIERVRRRAEVERDGNVYRPKSFDGSARRGPPH
jgi:hypothetical protein